MMYRSFALSAALISCVLLSIPTTSAAQTNVSGTIETATWTAANSPYRVTGTITVPEGNTLTIDAGVDVLFDADVQFIVEGAIRVHGTETDRVQFIKGTADQWHGIRISGSDSSAFTYTRISDGNARGDYRDHRDPDNYGGGLYITGEDTRVSMTSCLISDNSARDGGGLYNGGGTLTLTNCNIVGNTASVYSGGLDNRGTTTLTNCNISGNAAQGFAGGGLLNCSDGTLTLTNCTISWNTGGVNGRGLTGGGLYNARGTATLTDCVIS